MTISRRIFLLSPLALYGCRKSRKSVKPAGIQPKSQLGPPPQAELSRFIARFETTEEIDTKVLLGGKVLFASEFAKPKYSAKTKEQLLAKIRRTNFPSAYKAYNDDKVEQVHIVVPDSFIKQIRNSGDHYFLKAILFHVFAGAQSRDDIRLTKEIAALVQKTYTVKLSNHDITAFLNIGHALSSIKANFALRSYLARNPKDAKKHPVAQWRLKNIVDRDLMVWLRTLDMWLSHIKIGFPYAFKSILQVCLEFLEDEFVGLSFDTKLEVMSAAGSMKNKALRFRYH